MSKLVKLLGTALVILMIVAALAVIGGLSYEIWQFCVLFAQCGAEIKVIVMTLLGIVIIAVALFFINVYYRQRLVTAPECYRRKVDAYGRLLPLIAKMLHAGKNRRALLSERDREQLSMVLLELGLLVDDVQVNILGDFRQRISVENVPLHEILITLEHLLRDIRLDLGHRNIRLDDYYGMNRLWIDHSDKIFEMLEDVLDEKPAAEKAREQ